MGIFNVDDFLNSFEFELILESLKNFIVCLLPVDLTSSDALGESLETSGLY
jgi:hypothetical protein